MPVDKFGRMSDLKTKDTGVSLTYINNNYIRSNGETPLTGSLDMRGNTLYNVADPVNPQDVVTKVYVDNTKGSGVIGRKIGDSVSIKENLDFLGKHKIKNLPDPVDNNDAVNRDYVDNLAVNHPFEFKNNQYRAKADLYLQGNKIQGVGTPFNDGDVVTKGYVESVATPLLKLEEGEYKTKGDINMSNKYTLCNIKPPVKDEHLADKKYVDEMDNLKSAFTLLNGGYEAKGALYMRKNKLGGLREPTIDGEATTKKYVDDLVTNHFVDENDNIAFGRAVDMEGNKIFSLPEPEQDSDPATKKYVDDLQTQYIDKRGNIKFDRNINVGNNRIFALKDPKKDYEATNKKYVDESINKRLQEEKDNFLPKDPATKVYVDEAIKGLAGGDLLVSKEGVFIKANGHYRATAPLDIDNQKVENLPDPVDEKDAVNKKYIDGVVEALTLKQGLVRENGGFNLVDSYINMNFNPVRNIPYPHHNEDAVPRSFVENMVKTTLGQVQNQFKQLNQLVSVSGSFYGNLKKYSYQFSFGGPILNGKIDDQDKRMLSKINGFLVPANGVLKNFSTFSSGLIYNIDSTGLSFDEFTKKLISEYGNKDKPNLIFTLIKIERDKEKEIEVIGGIVYYFSNIIKIKDKYYSGQPTFEFRPKQKFLNKEENFICSVNQGDIINIRSEYGEQEGYKDHNIVLFGSEKAPAGHTFLHLATLTFMFKEMSFPNILNLNPLEEKEDD